MEIRTPSVAFVIFRMVVPLWFVMVPVGLVVALFELPLRMFRRRTQPKNPELRRIVFEPEGEASGATFLCLHGWPDHAVMWTEFARRQTARGHRVESLELPGFGETEVAGGYDFDAIVEALRSQVAAASERGPVLLALHDWGAVYGLMMAGAHPELLAGVVCLDVGRQKPDRGTTGVAAFTYQSYLAFAHVLGGFAGTLMARAMALAMKYKGRPLSEVRGSMNYPYRFAIAHVLRGDLDVFTEPLPELPPMLYAFGRDKPFYFHGKEFLQQLHDDPRSEVIGLDSGHWILTDALDELAAAVERWEPKALVR